MKTSRSRNVVVISLVLSLFFVSSFVCAEEKKAKAVPEQSLTKDKAPLQTKKNKTLPWALFFGTQSIHYAEMDHPTQIDRNFAFNVNIGAEFLYEINPYVGFAPSLSFSVVHYTNIGHHIVPAGDNRIATAFISVLDAPVLGIIPLGNWKISLGGGLAFLIRGAFRAVNVEGVSNADLAEVNSAFWKQGRFLAPSLQARVSYTLESGWRLGLFAKTVLPIANLWANEASKNIPFYDGLLSQFGIILFFPTKL